jgi:hypothetical protein
VFGERQGEHQVQMTGNGRAHGWKHLDIRRTSWLRKQEP